MDLLVGLRAEADIRGLQARYAQAADDGDASAFASHFTEDSVLVVEAQRIEGSAGVAAWLMQTLQFGPLRHLMMNPSILIETEDAASGTLDLVVLAGDGERWSVAGSARYADRYVP